TGFSWENTPIDELLQEDANDEGVKWRLQVLNDYMRPLRGGDFIVVAARPDQGKTTMLTSEVSYMAPQIPEERNILWVCNEGKASTIVKRLYQSAIGCSLRKLVKLSQAGKLQDAY